MKVKRLHGMISQMMMKTLGIVTKELQRMKGQTTSHYFKLRRWKILRSVLESSIDRHITGKSWEVFWDEVDKQAKKSEFKYLQKSGIDGGIC